MKKLILPILLIFTIIIAGCGNKKMTSVEVLEKNLKCQEFLDGYIENKVPLIGRNYNIGIFYSPKEKSCIGYYNNYDSYINDSASFRKEQDIYVIEGINGNRKESIYTIYRSSEGKSCEYSSDFRGKKGKFKCDDNLSNSKGKTLRLKEIEYLMKN